MTGRSVTIHNLREKTRYSVRVMAKPSAPGMSAATIYLTTR